MKIINLDLLTVNTLKAAAWRGSENLFDIRSHLRLLSGEPKLDLGFVTNLRDEGDQNNFLGNWLPKCGHADGPRFWFKGLCGQTRAIMTFDEDLRKSENRKIAKKQFVSTVKHLRQKGAKVILLAASTKRLFGDKAESLKALFPEILFTIGDNGTAYILCMETLLAFKRSQIDNENSRVAVLGANGYLGQIMTKFLIFSGYDVIGVAANKAAADRVHNDLAIKTCHQLDEIGKVDAIVACTNHPKITLTPENIPLLTRRHKLLVIDVAEPSNIRYKKYQKMKEMVVRMDAGNCYSPDFKYILGPVSWNALRLSRGVIFGCFAETFVIACELQAGNEEIKKIDFFDVNFENIKIIGEMMEKHGFIMPFPKCFSKPVKSFDLSGKENKQEIIPVFIDRNVIFDY
jgi:predicted amino acid dehydrogenase